MLEITSPLQMIPFAGGAGTMRMGLRPIEEAAWLQLGDEYLLRIQQKQRLLHECRKKVLCKLQDTSKIEYECLRLVTDHLAVHHANHPAIASELFALARQMSLQNSVVQCPLSVMTQLVEEDICLLEERNGQLILAAGSVCSPSWWSLQHNLGKQLLQIHAPVNGLQEKLGSMMTHFLQHLKPSKVYQRANWAIWPTASLCLFPNSLDIENRFAQIPENEIGQKIYLRVERQTLRRLPITGAVVFTIKVYVSPLHELTKHAGAAADLLHAIESLNESERSYRRVMMYEKKVARFLRSIM